MADKTERYLKSIDNTLKNIEKELKKLNKSDTSIVSIDRKGMHVKKINYLTDSREIAGYFYAQKCLRR